MGKIINGQNLTLGTCYYPEHWAKTLWEKDLDRMLDAGIKVIRIAEFAWNKFEPEEGVFTFDFFDAFLLLALEKGMQVIFCTPTATPPAWMSTKYPEILNADKEGNLYRHGCRRHYNYNSPKFREFTRRIVEKLGEHYGSHPAIIGWQLDNEFNCEVNEFYSESDTIAFRRFLKKKYGTLEALNDAWGTSFWNQTYTGWGEVDVPRKTANDTVNPHRLLDYYRFVSDSVCSFAKLQADILKKYIKPEDFITTNGIFGNLDNHRLREESLDFMTYDSYPNFAYCLDMYEEEDLLKDRKWSRNLTEVRAISPIFGIMEQQSGANGWTNRMEAPTPRPGQMTLWTMQSIAHGADFVSYFRWRTCTIGTEIYWHGILDYSGRENLRLREVKDIAGKLEKLQEVAGSRFRARVGILKDYDNIWDAQQDVWHARVDRKSQSALFTALQLQHVPVDFVYLPCEESSVKAAGALPAVDMPEENLSPERLSAGPLSVENLLQYEVLFYPHAVMLTKERMMLLENYVAAGGKLVMGCRTGYKDLQGRCVMDCLPGQAAKLTGTDIPEYSFVAPDDGKVMIDWDGEKAEAAVFNDLLAPVGAQAEVLAVYDGSYYQGTPALICNSFGKGKAYYFGGAFGLDTALLFLKKLGLAEPYGELLELPEGVELAVREKDGREYLFVLNYQREAVAITLKKPLRELLGETVNAETSGDEKAGRGTAGIGTLWGRKADREAVGAGMLCGQVTLPPYGVKVFVR